MKKIKFTVKRSEWLRGDPESYLLRLFDGKKCAMGFLALALGFTEKDIGGKCVYYSLEVDKFPACFFNDKRGTSKFCQEIIETNDTMKLTDIERESQLMTLFASKDMEIVFED